MYPRTILRHILQTRRIRCRRLRIIPTTIRAFDYVKKLIIIISNTCCSALLVEFSITTCSVRSPCSSLRNILRPLTRSSHLHSLAPAAVRQEEKIESIALQCTIPFVSPLAPRFGTYVRISVYACVVGAHQICVSG